MTVKTYTLNDSESKTLLEMAVECIDKGMVEENYDLGKINTIIDDSYNLYSANKQGIKVEIEVRLSVASK